MLYLHERLRELRGEVPLRAVAEETGYCVSYLSDLERGRTDPSFSCLIRIANFYQMSLVLLLTGVFIPDSQYNDMTRQTVPDVLPFE